MTRTLHNLLPLQSAPLRFGDLGRGDIFLFQGIGLVQVLRKRSCMDAVGVGRPLPLRLAEQDRSHCWRRFNAPHEPTPNCDVK